MWQIFMKDIMAEEYTANSNENDDDYDNVFIYE